MVHIIMQKQNIHYNMRSMARIMFVGTNIEKVAKTF